jgi:membrane-bound serine protease (ClpP class)
MQMENPGLSHVAVYTAEIEGFGLKVQLRGIKRRLAVIMLALVFWFTPAARAEQVGLIKISGAIGPATASYIQRAINEAAAQKYVCLIIQLDTPGGLLDSTKEIVQSLYSSSVPTVVYVAPAGATAASAGCFIALAADVAAMCPGTSIGAAHPVAMGGGITGQELDEVMKKKLENFATTFIESIAARRNRNVEWAKTAVRESAAITAEKALELNVIDIIAEDVPDLLKELDGREVSGRLLHTGSAEICEIPMLTRERTFQMLWRPEVMFILMLIAIYGIIGELSNPGAVIPGVVGAIALVLALYMASVLPVNIAGVALIVVAVGLFVTDIFAPTHGVLTAGGIISFFLGSLMLFDTAGAVFRMSLILIIPATLITAAFFIFVIGAGLRAQFLPIKAGKESLIGKTATAITAINAQSGRVFVEGSYWNAVSKAPVEEGKPVEIIGVEGLTLEVKPKT